MMIAPAPHGHARAGRDLEGASMSRVQKVWIVQPGVHPMRCHRQSFLRVLIVLLALATPIQSLTLSALAQDASSQVIGSSTVTFGGGWRHDPATSSDIQLALVHETLGETFFLYRELPDDRAPAADNAAYIDTHAVPGLKQALNLTELTELVTGTTPGSALWRLYAFEAVELSFVVLIAADVAIVPGMNVETVLLAPREDFAASLDAAQTGITVNGQPSLIGQVDSAAILAAIQVAGATPPPPTPATTPATAGRATTTQQVGTSTVTFTDTWAYVPEASSPPVLVLLHQELEGTTFIYGEIVDPTVTDVQVALDQFAALFTSEFDSGSSRLVTSGTIDQATGWRLYASTAAGVPVSTLITANVTAVPGSVILTALTVPVGSFDLGLVDAQTGIDVNGAGSPLASLDPAELAAVLEGGQPISTSTPADAAATETAAGTLTIAGDVSSYEAQDAAGCDAIGWVIVDPAQLPASQADLDYRGSCVGGATYVASCGVFDITEPPALVQCTVHIVAGEAPVAVSAQQFTLVDGTGAEYAVDGEATTLVVALFAAPVLPEGQVSANATASGTLIFAIPMSAPGPWTIRIATGAGQSGTLVLAGTLQPYEVFDR
jgi:hypothetical protein